MIRLVVLLVLANLGYWAWAGGLLAPVGLSPTSQSEPQRLSQQIRPEALRILTPQEAQQLSAGTLAPASGDTAPPLAPANLSNPAAGLDTVTAGVTAECLQAGLFTDAQAKGLQTRLETALPAGNWRFEAAQEPARWLVYMGKYSDADALAKKRGELLRLGVATEPLTSGALQPGLALAHFDTQAAASDELARIAKRGVRSARVVLERSEQRGQRLLLPSGLGSAGPAAPAGSTASAKQQLDAFKPLLAGKPLLPCSGAGKPDMKPDIKPDIKPA